MGYSNKYLEDLRNAGGVARGVRFDFLLVHDYYDGPESGFAFYSSGEGLRFSVIAEAKYPTFRAFAFYLLDGNWAQSVRSAADTAEPRNSVEWKADVLRLALWKSASDAADQFHYIGVGKADFSGFAMMSVSKIELDRFISSRHERDYYEIHRRIKEVEARNPDRVRSA
jgi:hypothetical protein